MINAAKCVVNKLQYIQTGNPFTRSERQPVAFFWKPTILFRCVKCLVVKWNFKSRIHYFPDLYFSLWLSTVCCCNHFIKCLHFNQMWTSVSSIHYCLLHFKILLLCEHVCVCLSVGVWVCGSVWRSEDNSGESVLSFCLGLNPSQQACTTSTSTH